MGTDTTTVFWRVPELASPYQFEEEKILEELDVVQRGLQDGQKQLPPQEQLELMPLEKEILGRCTAGLHDLRRYTESKLTFCRDRLQENSFTQVDSDLGDIEDKAKDQIPRAFARAQDDLIDLWTERDAYFRDLRYFQEQNGLNRSAHYPRSKLLPISLLVALVVVEAIINSNIFSKGSEYGLLGGWFDAAFVAIANVGLSVGAGIVIFRNLFHHSWLRKLVALPFALLFVIVIVGFNLATAHYRVLLDVDPTTALANAIPRLLATPFDVSNFQAVVLFAIGIIWALIACLDGYAGLDDRYPGYGKLTRRYVDSDDVYDERKAEVRSEIEKIGTDAAAAINAKVQGAQDKVGRLSAICNEMAKILLEHRLSADQVTKVFQRCIAKYRDANKKVRIPDTAPDYFSEGVELEGSDWAPEFVTAEIESLRNSSAAELSKLTDSARQLKSALMGHVKEEIDQLEERVKGAEEAAREEKARREADRIAGAAPRTAKV